MMNRKYFGLICFLALIVLAVLVGLFIDDAVSEAVEVWTVCKPDSFVNIRMRASGRSPAVGRAECGDRFLTDGKKKNRFLHVIHAPTETGDGWISLAYVVWDCPVWFGEEAEIESRGRVACRKNIGGARIGWLKNGTKLTVYCMTEEWAVTNRGFVQAQYIGAF